jgi:hypothetical protein
MLLTNAKMVFSTANKENKKTKTFSTHSNARKVLEVVLELIIMLDKAKLSHVLTWDPCLFKKVRVKLLIFQL